MRQSRPHGVTCKTPQPPSTAPENVMLEKSKIEETMTLSLNDGLLREAAPIARKKESPAMRIYSMVAALLR
jgi:hypothetical protein